MWRRERVRRYPREAIPSSSKMPPCFRIWAALHSLPCARLCNAQAALCRRPAGLVRSLRMPTNASMPPASRIASCAPTTTPSSALSCYLTDIARRPRGGSSPHWVGGLGSPLPHCLPAMSFPSRNLPRHAHRSSPGCRCTLTHVPMNTQSTHLRTLLLGLHKQTATVTDLCYGSDS